MAGLYSCNPKIKKFNQSIINDPSAMAKRAAKAKKKGTIKGYGAYHAK